MEEDIILKDPVHIEEHSRLHPDDYDVEHISGLDVFVQDLQKALKGAFPRQGSPYPYTSVHALLIRWEDDDMGIHREIEKLASALRRCLNFEVEEGWTIPSENPQRALRQKLYTFQDAHQSEDELLIFYYGGHGRQDRYGRSIWRAQYYLWSPSLSWSSLQTELEDAIPHVLIILDCCYAANATGNLIASKTTKEILAACSRECPIRSSGFRSYTSAIVDEIAHIGNLNSERERVSAAMLHSRLMSVKGRLSYTPTYTLLSEHGGSSIIVAPRPIVATPSPQAPSTSSTSLLPTSRSLRLEHLKDGLQLSQHSSQSSYAAETKVLIAVSIAEISHSNLAPDVNAWRRWLTTGTPLEIRNIDIELENVYHSHSMLAIFSIPVVVWTRLPDQAAYRFIGYVSFPYQNPKLEQSSGAKFRDRAFSSREYGLSKRISRTSQGLHREKNKPITAHSEPYGPRNMDPLHGYLRQPETDKQPVSGSLAEEEYVDEISLVEHIATFSHSARFSLFINTEQFEYSMLGSPTDLLKISASYKRFA